MEPSFVQIAPLAVPFERQSYGRYRLLYRLATGGMAHLYLGRVTGPDGFERLVAIKQIHEHLTAQPEFVKMFKDEARLAARIYHPNVVQVIELGQVGESYFIAMEYIEGESLTHLIRRTEVPLTYCARIVADALAGLRAAHELRTREGELLQVVHRDLSPSNILISYDGAVKVVDFGVAKARGNLSSSDPGTVKGKFAYMSPEQVRNEEVDQRSDIFACGILLFEATTRRHLFKGENDAATVAKILNEEVTRPSLIVPGYPPALERIVLRALKTRPDERYPTAREMQEALEKYIFGAGVPVGPAHVGELMRRVFAEEIKQKRALLRQAPPSIAVPALKADTAELELVDEPDRAPGRRLWLVVGGGLLVIAVIVGIVLLLREPASGPTPDPGIGRAVRTVRISIRARPAEATITLDGRRVSNPLRVERPQGSGMARVAVSAPGYVEQTLEISLATGGTYDVVLARPRVPDASAAASAAPDAARPRVGSEKKRGGAGETRPKGTGKGGKKPGKKLFGNPY